MNHRQARTLCLALAAFFLIVGWWPFTPFPRNHVSWLSGRHGLAFTPQGVAYDPEPLPVPVAHPSSNHAPGFAVELSLEPSNEPDNSVPHILTIHDGRRPSGFVVGQWQSELLLRVPAAGNPNRIREVGIPNLRRGQRHVIVISGDAIATTFYVDGRLSRRISDFVLEPGSMRGQLILGNAATGKRSWAGTLFGVAIFNRALEPQDVAAHQNLWMRGTALDLAGEPGLAALYNFAEGTGQETRDHSPAHHHLLIPARYVVLEKTVLGRSTAIAGWSATRDIVLNVLGFVPFGFLSFRSYQGTSAARWMQAVIIPTLAGATLSLIIEVGQVWLPTRNSSLLDLFCNTIGTGIGVLLADWTSESRRRG